MGTQCEYSDFYNTCYCNLYKLIKQKEVNQLSYDEFFGGKLITKVKEEIGYTPDKGVCAYGFHPAMLSYNGITTIDGYCGYYSQEYKEKFREAIAPTLEANTNWKVYYDEWGCRAYLFSASGENLHNFGANTESISQEILINEQALKELGKLKGKVGTTILSAAIIDDVIGIIVLISIISSIGGSSSKSSSSSSRPSSSYSQSNSGCASQ